MRKSISRKSKDYKSYYAFNKSLDRTKKRYPSLNIMESVIIKNQYTLNTYSDKIASKFENVDFAKRDEATRKLIIKFYKLMKADNLFNEWFSEASESFEIKGRKTPRTNASKFDKFFIETIFNNDNKNNVNKNNNDFKKQDEEFLKVENNLNVLKKLMVECLRKVQKDTGKYLDADISKLRVAFTIRNKNVLGTHYGKSWDKGNFKDKQGNKVSHIVIRKNVLMNDNEKIIYNPSSFDDTSSVALHELGHLIIPNSGNHNQAFEDCMIDFKQEIISGKGTRKCMTYHAKTFKKYFSEIYKRLSKEWNASEGMHTNISERTKTITLKCRTCGSRVSIPNQSKKHNLCNFYCDHEGTEFQGLDKTQMEQHSTKKPRTFTGDDK